MTYTIKKIIDAVELSELLKAIEEFCSKYSTKDDEECMALVEQVSNKVDSDFHMLLDSYLSICEDGEEVIESLNEFITNCKGFVETDDEMTKQVTKTEFEAILDECDEKCKIKECITKNHILKIAEVPMKSNKSDNTLQIKGDNINILLPKIDVNVNTKEYIASELGTVLYDVIIGKIPYNTILNELNIYIPETKRTHETPRELFKKYFYSVVKYERRKPGIYPCYDEHMKCIIEKEFFKRIVLMYLTE